MFLLVTYRTMNSTSCFSVSSLVSHLAAVTSVNGPSQDFRIFLCHSERITYFDHSMSVFHAAQSVFVQIPAGFVSG